MIIRSGINTLTADFKQVLSFVSSNVGRQVRRLSSVAEPEEKPSKKGDVSKEATSRPGIPGRTRYIYPEFLPHPNMKWRNQLREKLEREDMVHRRSQIDIPEFYVGSVLAVTTSDPHAQGKVNRFVGICIERTHTGLRADFTLRNIVDHLGVEIRYEMYNPTVQKIEVLRLEKRLDEHLRYLRDALPEYSTFPFDMEPEYLPEGAEVPVNTIQVKLKPRPWLERWERQDLKGLQDLGLPERFYKRAEELATPWEKYDLLKQYRATIPEDEQVDIYSEVYDRLREMETARKKIRRKQMFVKPKKTV